LSDDGLLIQDILEAISRIEEYTLDGEDVFFEDRRTQDAVIRNLEIIGEATKNLSSEFTESHPRIPWKAMAGMRDKLIHDYPGVDLLIVWNVVVNELPPARDELMKLFEDEPQ
jgi:uncharacterized protein with HEPN domain